MITNNKVARRNMINSQLETNLVNEDNILAAIELVPREEFVPEIYKKTAYIDSDIKLEDGRFLLKPVTFAQMLKIADLSSKHNVLDIACGTGYSSAVISKLVNKVTGIENSTKLTSVAKSNITKLEIDNAFFSKTAIEKGFSKDAPYDVIFIQGKAEKISPKLFEQLKPSGKLISVSEDGYITAHVRTGKVVAKQKYYQAHAPLVKAFKNKESFTF